MKRFHVAAKGGTFVNKEYRFSSMKRKVVSKRGKKSSEHAHREHLQHLRKSFPLFVITLEKKWSTSWIDCFQLLVVLIASRTCTSTSGDGDRAAFLREPTVAIVFSFDLDETDKHTPEGNPLRTCDTALSVPVDPASSFSSSLAMIICCFLGWRAGKRLESSRLWQFQSRVPGAGVGPSSSSTSSMVGE